MDREKTDDTNNDEGSRRNDERIRKGRIEVGIGEMEDRERIKNMREELWRYEGGKEEVDIRGNNESMEMRTIDLEEEERINFGGDRCYEQEEKKNVGVKMLRR